MSADLMGYPLTISSIVFGCITFVSLIWFTLRIKKEPIKSRTPMLVYPSAIYCVYATIILSFTEELRSNNKSNEKVFSIACRLSYWNLIFIPTFWLLPHFSRATILYFRSKWAVWILHAKTDSFEKKSYSSQENSVDEKERTEDYPTNKNKNKNCCQRTASFFSFQNFKLYTSPAYHFTVFILVNFITFIAGGISDSLDPSECSVSMLYIAIIETCLIIIGWIFACVKLYKIEDGYYIKQEFTMYAIFIPLYLISVSVTGFFGPSWVAPLFFLLFFFVSLLTSVIFPTVLTYSKIYAMSHHHFSYGVESRGRSSSERSNIVSFDEIFEYPEMLSEFTAFSTKLWCVENLLFYLDVRQFETLHTTEQKELEKRAKAIHKTYLRPDSIKLVNLDAIVFKNIEEKLERGEINKNMFDDAKINIEKLLKYDTFVKWQYVGKGTFHKKTRDQTRDISSVSVKLQTHEPNLQVN